MNILIISKQRYLLNRIKEFLSQTAGRFYFAANHEEAIGVLNNHLIDVAVLELRMSPDVGLLKYINETFENIRVALIADDEIMGIISAIKYGKYSLMSDSLELSELRAIKDTRIMNGN